MVAKTHYGQSIQYVSITETERERGCHKHSPFSFSALDELLIDGGTHVRILHLFLLYTENT